MRYYAGLDVSLETTSICVMDAKGSIIREGVVRSEPRAIASWLRQDKARYVLVGLEAGSISTWLQRGLVKLRLPAICIEARHAHLVLKANLNKTDRNDARGIAELLRVGIFRHVHMKSAEARDMRSLLAARRL